MKQGLEPFEVLALLTIGDLLGRALIRSRPDVLQVGNIGPRVLHPELGEELVIIDCVDDCRRVACRQQPLMIQRLKQHATLVEHTKPIETHRIQPFEDVAVFSMLRRAAVLLDEPLNLLEARDYPLLARCPTRFLLGLSLDAKLFEERVVLVGELRHERPRPSCAPGTPHPRPYASPRRPWT